MGLDRNNIPDEYLCEVCKPRPIDRKRAKSLQARRRNELFHSSSDDSPRRGVGPGGKPIGKKMNDRKAVAGLGGAPDGPKRLIKKGASLLDSSKKDKNKKQYRKRKPSEKDKKPSAKKAAAARRKSSGAAENEYDSDVAMGVGGRDSDDDGLLAEPSLDASQQLRSWIDQYEEAVTNHYSQELRARLIGSGSGKPNGIASDLRPSVLHAPIKSNVSLKGNGVKVRHYFDCCDSSGL